MGWAALVEYVAASDDRVERYFLEVKSDIDLNVKHGRHKVAKFILAAGNREPTTGKKRFDGYAIMILGVGADGVLGVSSFEALDLAREVAKFTGPDGPPWDFERIPTETGAMDVVAIVVDPPLERSTHAWRTARA